MDSTWSLRGEVIAYDGQDKVSAYNNEQPTAGYGIVNGMFTLNPGGSVRIELQGSNLFDRGYQNHLAGVNRVQNVDIPAGERLWGAERTFSVGAVVMF